MMHFILYGKVYPTNNSELKGEIKMDLYNVIDYITSM
jgi:hypothetical protein